MSDPKTQGEKKGNEMNIDQAMALVRAEYMAAAKKFPAFHSAHEGYAVILEELDELWADVKQNNNNNARNEAIQVAAMAIRFYLDLDPYR